MRPLLPFLSIVALTGCAGYSPLPGKAPADALASMYTATPPQQVATCIAQAVGGSVQANGTVYTITGQRGATYTVEPNQGDSVYPVRVVVRGTVVPIAENEHTALCLRGNGQAA